MLEWADIGLIASALAAFGYAVDRFLLHRQKSWLHLFLTRLWNQLDEVTLRDFPKLMVEWIFETASRVWQWRIFSWQTAALLFLVSFGLTWIAAFLGEQLEGVHFSGRITRAWHGLFLLNFLFDYVAFVTSFWILTFIRKAGSAGAVLLIFMDFAIAFVLAIVCGASLFWVSLVGSETLSSIDGFMSAEEGTEIELLDIPDDILSRNLSSRSTTFASCLAVAPLVLRSAFMGQQYQLAHEVYYWIGKDPGQSIRCVRYERTIAARWSWIFASITSLVPILLYMSLLLLMFLGKLVLNAVRFFMMHILELLTEADPEKDPKNFLPGTLVGLLLGLVTTITNLLVRLGS